VIGLRWEVDHDDGVVHGDRCASPIRMHGDDRRRLRAVARILGAGCQLGSLRQYGCGRWGDELEVPVGSQRPTLAPRSVPTRKSIRCRLVHACWVSDQIPSSPGASELASSPSNGSSLPSGRQRRHPAAMSTRSSPSQVSDRTGCDTGDDLAMRRTLACADPRRSGAGARLASAGSTRTSQTSAYSGRRRRPRGRPGAGIRRRGWGRAATCSATTRPAPPTTAGRPRGRPGRPRPAVPVGRRPDRIPRLANRGGGRHRHLAARSDASSTLSPRMSLKTSRPEQARSA
jgi:hypothetical protein